MDGPRNADLPILITIVPRRENLTSSLILGTSCHLSSCCTDDIGAIGIRFSVDGAKI